jgi:alpha-tubulin suppressor-like RCC1 family protein
MKKRFSSTLILIVIVFLFSGIKSNAQSIAAGGAGFTFTICNDSTLYAWGVNQDGQLGYW